VDELLMSASLLPPVAPRADLATLSLKDCPDPWTAIQAGLAHGLTPKQAITSAFGEFFLSQHAETLQAFEIANFYDGTDQPRAMLNTSALVRLLTLMVFEQSRQIAALHQEAARMRALLPYLPPSTE
jgi:hypothetical protein